MSQHNTRTSPGLAITRTFTADGSDSVKSVRWETRDALITNARGGTVFEQKNVRVPVAWSQTATNIVASKYFHGMLNSPARETGVDQLVSRVVTTITDWGTKNGYFASDEDAAGFSNELSWLLLNQYASFNSPVWFNVGCDRLEPDADGQNWHWDPSTGGVRYSATGYRNPQCSACFINSVDDSMESILTLAKTEGMLFKWGSGTGSNLSAIRGSMEPLRGGGVASGPLSFMRGYDAFAGAIKSGGKTRRAAKMVILNADHPDIEEFIACKGKEEAKARALMTVGYDGSTPDGEAYTSIFYQNANNSVRVTDEFMQAAIDGADWTLTARTDGSPVKTVKASDLLRKIADETWHCGDPGMQFDSTINRWHTSKNSGRINASNPCSEYLFLDDSACNLASFNLVKFLRPDGTFDAERFRAAVRIFIIAQDILVDHSGYPTERIAQNSHDYRPLGLGYANLGALLLRMCLPYDSDKGREVAAAITAIMGGQAYLTSAEVAETMPPLSAADAELRRNITDGDEDAPVVTGMCPGYYLNEEPFLAVVDMHLAAARRLQPVSCGLEKTAVEVWERARTDGDAYGFRNSQVTVLAPTGTIGFMLDCDSTGIEPMIGLVAYKKLVGGGQMTLTNASVPAALELLGYSPAEIDRLSAWIAEHGAIEGAGDLKQEHAAIFDCALKPTAGTRSISWTGHLKMMAAVQPFLSGAISKTVNMPHEASVEDVIEAYIEAWKLGLKAIAIYRDGSKAAQPLTLTKESSTAPATVIEPEPLDGPPRANRHRLPEVRPSVTHHFKIANHEGYLTVGLYPNGVPGEMFLKMAKEGSTISGLMDTIATTVSVSLQHGVPLKVFCEKFAHMRFEPSGWTGNEQIGYAKSLMDYIFRWLELRFLKGEQLSMFNLPVTRHPVPPEKTATREQSITDLLDFGDAPSCPSCGAVMYRAGSCFRCECGDSSGCG